MKIVIVGAGEVGFHLAKILSQEHHDIVVIDSDEERVSRVNEHLDVIAIEGSGISPIILAQAGVENADLLVAVSPHDEINILACQIATKLGAKKTIARISNIEFNSPDSLVKPEQLGINLSIYPEEVTAEEIVRLVKRASATDVLEFGEGRIQIIGVRLDGSSPLINRTMRDVVKDFTELVFRVVAISRGARTIIPTGNDVFKKNDQVFTVCKTEYVQDMLRLAGKEGQDVKNVMILGGGKIGTLVAEQIEDDVNVKIIESNKDRSIELADKLRRALVIQGEGSDIDLLAKEGIMDMDVFISVTEDEETNIISCLMAKHLGVPKTIALVENSDYVTLAGTIGLDVAVNKKLSAAQIILKFIRKGEILSVATLHGVDAEVIELIAQKGSDVTKKPLKDVKFPEGAIIGCVIRDNSVMIPVGSTKINPNERVVVFTLPKAIPELEKFFNR
ncbi:MAG: Trk system potassium transporter TrkA [Bacteroidota bacterium]|nr:Trk system potassium transporter TrkA [Bacteroidota bacterium]